MALRMPDRDITKVAHQPVTVTAAALDVREVAAHQPVEVTANRLMAVREVKPIRTAIAARPHMVLDHVVLEGMIHALEGCIQSTHIMGGIKTASRMLNSTIGDHRCRVAVQAARLDAEGSAAHRG